MKSNSNILFRSLAVTGMLAPFAVAIEAPADDAPPPALDGGAEAVPVFPKKISPPAPAAPMDQEDIKAARSIFPNPDSAFLGVVTGNVPPAVSAHLDLPAGQGLIIHSFHPSSPCPHAGIGVYDIITQVDGKAIGSCEALTQAVMAHNPGETLRIDYIHKGRPNSTEVTLITRPDTLPPVAQMDMGTKKLQIGGIPEDFADRIRQMIEGNVGNLDLQIEDLEDQFRQFQNAVPRAEHQLRELQEELRQCLRQFGPDRKDTPRQATDEDAATSANLRQSASVNIMDEHGSLEVSCLNGDKQVIVRDKENHVTWSGPWNTDADKQAAPPQVRERVEKLKLDDSLRGNGLSLRFHQDDGQ